MNKYVKRIIVDDFKDSDGTWVKSYSKDGEYFTTRSYILWKSINCRCTDNSYAQSKNKNYLGSVNNFESFQLFTEWCNKQHGYNFKDSSGRYWQIDKDLKSPGTREYSPETCLFVPNYINSLLMVKETKENALLLGVKIYDGNRFSAQIYTNLKKKHLGVFETELEAHQAWQQEKLRYIKSIISTDLDYLGVDVIEALSKYATKLENDIANKLISLRSWPHELLEYGGNLPQRYQDIPKGVFV